MKKIYKSIIIVFCLFTINIGYGQIIGDVAASAEADASKYLGNYFEPLIISTSTGLANGWNNTAKPHKLFGFDITATVSVAGIPDADYMFTFKDSEYNNIRVAGGAGEAEVPTFAGGNSDVVFEVYDPNIPTQPTTSTFEAPAGVDLGSIPVIRAGAPIPTVHLGFGLPKGTEIRARFIPVSNVGDEVSVKGSFGLGVKHDIKQWIPGFNKVPIDVSAFIGYNQFKFQYLDSDNNEVNFVSKATTFELLVSKKLLFFTPYMGLGANMINSDFNFTATDPDSGEEVSGTYDYDNIGGARFTIGGRLKFLWAVTLNVDYTFQRYNTLTVGFGINVR